MEINRESVEKSFKYLKLIKENHKELTDKCISRLKMLSPFTEYYGAEDFFYPPKITDLGVNFRYKGVSLNLYSSRYEDYNWKTLQWKYINMTDEEFSLELVEIEKEKDKKEIERKQKEIQDLESKIAKLKNE